MNIINTSTSFRLKFSIQYFDFNVGDLASKIRKKIGLFVTSLRKIITKVFGHSTDFNFSNTNFFLLSGMGHWPLSMKMWKCETWHEPKWNLYIYIYIGIFRSDAQQIWNLKISLNIVSVSLYIKSKRRGGIKWSL